MCLYIKMVAYWLPNWEGGFWISYKSACTSSSFFDIAVKLWFCLTTCIDLLPTHSVQSLSRILLSFIAFVWLTIAIASAVLALWGWICCNMRLSESDKSDLLELLESMSMLARSYFVSWEVKAISLTSLDALTMSALLMWARRQCQSWMHLFLLTR